MDWTAAAKMPSRAGIEEVPEGTDLIEWYYEQGYSDGFPLVPPTPGEGRGHRRGTGRRAGRRLSRVPPRWGSLTREVLAINMVMAGCRPEYAPVVRGRAARAVRHALQPERRAGDDAHGEPAARGERPDAQRRSA